MWMCWSSQSEQPDPQVCRWVPKLVVAVADQDQRLLVGLWPQCRGVSSQKAWGATSAFSNGMS